MQRDADGAIEILVVTFWELMDAVRAFAGDEAARAYLPPEVVATLDRYDEEVVNYNLVIDETVPG